MRYTERYSRRHDSNGGEKKGGGLGRTTICNPTQAFLVSLLRSEHAILTIARERLNIDIWKVTSLRSMQPFVCDLDGKLDKPLKAPPLLLSGSAAFIFIKYLQKIKSYRGWARNGSLGTSANMTKGFQILRFPLSAFSLLYSLHNRRTGRDKGGPQAFLYPNFVPDSIYAFASRL